GRTVSRKQLKDAIWGADISVEESALGFQINQARKALADDPNEPQYIKTFPRHGFRFIANVTPFCESELPGPTINSTQGREANPTFEVRRDNSNDRAIKSALLMKG